MLLAGIADNEPGPEARYESREAISLAFITAVQLLPPRQRAVLLLRDLLGFSAREAAAILGGTQASVTSALKRARTAIKGSTASPCITKPGDAPAGADLAERLTSAYQAGDVAAIIALFTDDAWLRMPPVPLEYQGRELIGQFLRSVAFRDAREPAARVRVLLAGRDRAERPAGPGAHRQRGRGANQRDDAVPPRAAGQRQRSIGQFRIVEGC